MSQTTVAIGAKGTGLTVLGSGFSMGLQLVSVTVLSRLLSPRDFGLVAMVSVFIALGTIIRDFGMPTAALQAKSLSHQQASNLFWVNTAFAAIASILLAASTPLLVMLYSEPRLAAVVPAMASVILITGVGAQIQIDLARQLKFRALVLSDISGQVLGLATAIVMALIGLGYWALVAQALVTALVTLAMRVATDRWVPARFRRGHDSRKLFQAGAEYGVAYLLTFAQQNADTLIVGATLGATPLGYYNRGYQLLTTPVGRLLDPLSQVVVPTLNRVRAEGGDLNAMLLKVQFAVGCVIVWIFAMAGATAHWLVPLLLGPGWAPTIRVFQILAIGGSIWVFSVVSSWVFILYEQSRQLLRYNLISKPLAVACLAIGAFFGIDGVAWGYVAAMALSWPLNLIWLARTAGLPAPAFARNGATIIATGAIASAAAMTACSVLPTMSAVPTIGVGMLIGTGTMLGLLIVVPATRRHLIASLRLVRGILTRKAQEA